MIWKAVKSAGSLTTNGAHSQPDGLARKNYSESFYFNIVVGSLPGCYDAAPSISEFCVNQVRKPFNRSITERI